MKILFFSTFFLTTNLFANGRSVGNGGGIHNCPEQAFQEFYDVYEGRTRYDLDISTKNDSQKEIIERALEKLRSNHPLFANEVEEKLSYIDNPKNFLMRQNINLFLVEDANILLTDTGCEYKQLANWDSISNKLIVRSDYYDKLDDFNKAAFKLHEAIYKAARDRFSQLDNSDYVRRRVAELLSTEEKITPYFENANDLFIFEQAVDPFLTVEDSKDRFEDYYIKAHLGDFRISNSEYDSIRIRSLSPDQLKPFYSYRDDGCKEFGDYELVCPIKNSIDVSVLANNTRDINLQISIVVNKEVISRKIFNLKYKERAWTYRKSINLGLKISQNL